MTRSTPTADASTDALSPDGLPFTPLADLLAEPEETCAWLVEKRLPAAGLSVLAGKPKAGKSTLVRQLALAVARGAPWLGSATAQGPVLYLALEEKRAEVRRHFLPMGADPDDPVFVFCAPSPADGLARARRSWPRRPWTTPPWPGSRSPRPSRTPRGRPATAVGARKTCTVRPRSAIVSV